MKLHSLFFLICPIVFSSCTSAPRTWGNAAYKDPGYEPGQETHYNEGLDEYDQHRLLSAVIAQLEKCPKMRKNSVYMLSNFENQTSGELDLAMLNRELNDHLTASGFTIIDKSARPDVFQEKTVYQGAGETAPHLAARHGIEAGVEYVIRAMISAKSQSTDSEKLVRYRMTLQTVNLESSVVMCSPAIEIKKRYERTRVAL